MCSVSQDHRVHVHDPFDAVLWFVCHGCEIHFMAVDLKNKKVKAFKPAIVKMWSLVPWESPDHSRVLGGQSYYFHNMSTLCIGLFHRAQFAWVVHHSVRASTWMRQWSWYTPVTTAYSLHMKEWERNRTSLMNRKAVSFYYCHP